MTELEEQLKELIRVMMENQPRVTSDRYVVGDTDTVSAGTSLTVTFTLSNKWVTRLVTAYCDDRSGCTYNWWLNGQSYDLNELNFYKGKPITSKEIVLIISNTSASDTDVAYYIRGWGDLKAGG